MLSQICQLEDNEAVVMERMTSEAYARIVQLLMVPDIRLIVHSLEALYQLSELGSACATMIAGVGHSVGVYCFWGNCLPSSLLLLSFGSF